MWFINTRDYYLALRKDEYLPSHRPGAGGYYAEGNKSMRERQRSYAFTPMWHIRNREEDHRGREGKIEWEVIREGEKP